MAKLEDLKVYSRVLGLDPSGPVEILNVHWYGTEVVEVTYRDLKGNNHSELLYRNRESELEVLEPGPSWAFDTDGHLFRLVSEAFRIRNAYLFDPWMAVHLSQIEPLPHQITAVYQEMLPRQPLRFLLADDPGAGKTIMTGLLIKELMLRGDLQRCLVVAPGNLVEQWQDELNQRFNLSFDILTNDRINTAKTGNPFDDMPLVIARLDKLSRDETLQNKLSNIDWDLVVVDEAHKMSASVFNGEIQYTKRYRLGEFLSKRTRHFLLLTATPHNGKEEDFQLFMRLLDVDRFEGRYREGVHNKDASDLIRRLVKEELKKFDGSPLFPERRAYTIGYTLSDLEALLYEKVTSYVRDEFNRADNLDKERRGTVGFALTILQRRLASSPEAIYQSLRRRRERLETRLREEKIRKRGLDLSQAILETSPALDTESLEDLEDTPEEELEQVTEQVLDSATAARTIAELEQEIHRLKELEALADQVRRSGQDRKWKELSRILQERPEFRDSSGSRRKLVIFTEHKDTLNYLANKIRSLLGREDAVVVIYGGMDREARRIAQQTFVQDKDVLVLVATDAAGEGINLQRAHLMVNYDLPWNPIRLEQRFGRIHRIGQTEICHMWNLVAEETREGDVYARLLRKIENQREALGDGVFDILGKLFREKSLRELLLDAIRYGDRPEVRERLFQAVDNLADQQHIRKLLEDRSLAQDSMDVTEVFKIREDFERAQAKRLQPHFIESFFKAAFEHLGGSMHPREALRYEVTNVPQAIRNRGKELGLSVLKRYERITFHKEAIQPAGKPTADFVCPGHPLMDAVTDLILERYRGLLRQGSILVDPNDPSDQVRVLFYLEHNIQDARSNAQGERRVISRQLQFVEINASHEIRDSGPAPFLDYQPLDEGLYSLVEPVLKASWLKTDLESAVKLFAVQHLAPRHLEEVRSRREAMIQRTMAAVKERLTKEIAYWDHRAEDLRAKEKAGKGNPHLNSEMARRRAIELQNRLENRLSELEQERRLFASPPNVIGGALIIPMGLLNQLQGFPPTLQDKLFARQRDLIEMTAMNAVMQNERALGYEPRDVSAFHLGWDIESRTPGEGKLRFIEVKGRIEGAETITVTRNEILAALNKPEDFILAVVEIHVDHQTAEAKQIHYIQKPFQREPDFGAVSVNYKWEDLLRLSN